MKIKVLNLKPTAWFVPFSWILRIFQNTDFSHMAILICDDVLDATIKGVNWTNIDDYKKHYSIVKETEIEISDGTEIYSWAATMRAQCQGYSVIQNIGLGLKNIGIIKKNPFGSDTKYLVCCELCVIFLDRFVKGFDIGDSDNYDLVMVDNIVDDISGSQKGI